jgi:hypothetical protein
VGICLIGFIGVPKERTRIERIVELRSKLALFFTGKKIGENLFKNLFNLFHQCSKKTSETNDVAKAVW